MLLRDQLSKFEPTSFLKFLLGNDCAQFVPCYVVLSYFVDCLLSGFPDQVLLLEGGLLGDRSLCQD